MKTTLRPAKELTDERNLKTAARKERDFDIGMERACRAIAKAHDLGLKFCTEMTFSEDVVRTLRKGGYTVRNYPAAGMGDMESCEITWK